MTNKKYLSAAVERFEAAKATFKNPQHPLKLIHVSPWEIGRICRFHLKSNATGSKWNDWGKIQDGNWDDLESMSANPTWDRHYLQRSVFERFYWSKPWEQTELFEKKMSFIEKNGVVDHCRNREELIARYNRLDSTFEDICKNGFKGLAQGGALKDSLTVSITRHGQFMLASGGAHRLAIAKLLRLPSIPVLVMMRHTRWQDVLDSKENLDAAVRGTHPDLVEAQVIELQ